MPRPSKGGRDIGINEIKESSRGKNWSQDKASGATKTGREYVSKDGTKKQYWRNDPDGNPNTPGPEYHKSPHTHSVNKKGEEKIFVYPD